VKTAPGVTVAEVLNDFETDAEGRYMLPNLQAGSPLDVVVRLRVSAGPEGGHRELATFELSFVGQESKLPETVATAFAADFAAAGAVASMPVNTAVVEAVALLMNARARREAMRRMDERDFEGAQFCLASVVGGTEILFSHTGSPALAAELDDLRELGDSLRSRENDAFSRKKMAYRREMVRKSK
jgi:Ca-activated chloride channel family protein